MCQIFSNPNTELWLKIKKCVCLTSFARNYFYKPSTAAHYSQNESTSILKAGVSRSKGQDVSCTFRYVDSRCALFRVSHDCVFNTTKKTCSTP